MQWLFVLQVLLVLGFCSAGTKNKPHPHQGILQPYNNKHIGYTISLQQNAKLDAGESVTIHERSGKDGRGIVIQDIHAPPEVCMDRIRDLTNYHKMVPKVKKVEPYEHVQLQNGTTKTGAEFSVGLSLLTFGYYLNLTFEPKYYTLTWTLDYKYNSDVDDSTGHWQVMPHPTKSGWSRVLYSTEVKMQPWIPEFVITFMTKTALVESTAWVKKESEKMVAAAYQDKTFPAWTLADLTSCFVKDDQHAKYDPSCANQGAKVSKEEL